MKLLFARQMKIDVSARHWDGCIDVRMGGSFAMRRPGSFGMRNGGNFHANMQFGSRNQPLVAEKNMPHPALRGFGTI